MILEPIAPATLPPSGPKIAPPSAPNAIAVPRPSFHFLPAARLETTWPAPEEIAPITIAATMPAARPPVPMTSAVSATATTRLTQKPGSESSLVTNSNAALSAFHAAFAALLILPQRPPSSFGGSFDASALTLAWPSETLPWFSPGILPVPLWTLAAVASSLPFEPAQARRELRLDLAAGLLDLAAELGDGLVAGLRGRRRGALDLGGGRAGEVRRAGGGAAGRGRGARGGRLGLARDALLGGLRGGAGGVRGLLGGLARADDAPAS